MGLLTSDREENGFLLKCLTKYSNIMATFAYALALLSFTLFISEGYIDTTYFSDNALLPGLANRDYKHEIYGKEILKNLTYETSNKHLNEKIPYDWLRQQFRSIGIEVYEQRFQLNYPFGIKQKYNGKNMYAILRAPRAASTEALILSTGYRTDENIHGSNLPSIALMLSLAKFFSRNVYWAKDIIFLISEYELVGVQAWLNSYHGLKTNEFSTLVYDELEQRSGAIQAAINLEIHSDLILTLDLKIEGLNGQLPNLDLFNIAVELATREGITPTFHGQSHIYSSDNNEILKQYFSTMSSMMISQGIGLPTGAHGVFQKFGIQSLTLEAFAKSSKYADQPGSGFQALGRLLEGIFRCLNNLLEKFNRSYWFYLLPSTRRYFSIGYYMIPFGLLLLPLLLKAVRIYIEVNSDDESDGDAGEPVDVSDDKQKKLKKKKVKSETKENIFLTAFSLPVYCYLLGMFISTLPFLLEKFPQYQLAYNLDTIEILYYSLLLFSIITLFNPLFKTNKASEQEQVKANHCVALLNLSLLLGSLSLLNISLAIALTLIYCPIIFILPAKSSKLIYRIISKLLLLLLHPLCIGFICIFSLSYWYDMDKQFLAHFSRAYDGHKKSLLFYIEDWYIYGNWTYFFGCVFLFPVWLQFWFIV